MTTDRLSDLKLATGDVKKRIGTERRRPALSCNALAVDTCSSFYCSHLVIVYGQKEFKAVAVPGILGSLVYI